jgi:hypothetical protein
MPFFSVVLGLLVGGLLDQRVQLQLADQAQGHRIDRLDVGRVPVGAVAHLLDGGLGGAQQAWRSGVGHFRVVAQEPGDGVRTVLAARHRGVARAFFCGFSSSAWRLTWAFMR